MGRSFAQIVFSYPIDQGCPFKLVSDKDARNRYGPLTIFIRLGKLKRAITGWQPSADSRAATRLSASNRLTVNNIYTFHFAPFASGVRCNSRRSKSREHAEISFYNRLPSCRQPEPSKQPRRGQNPEVRPPPYLRCVLRLYQFPKNKERLFR